MCLKMLIFFSLALLSSIKVYVNTCIRKVLPKTYILMSLKREFIFYWLQEEEKYLKNQYFGQGKIEFGQGKVREFYS